MSKHASLLIVLAILITAAIVPMTPREVSADAPPTPEAVLTQVFTTPSLQAEWFAPSFLAQVPLAQAQQILDQYRSQLGAFRSVSPAGAAYLVRFEHGSVRATIALDGSGAIDTFVLGLPISDDRESAYRNSVAAIRALPGDVSLLITRNGVDREALSADSRLAVGSAFKLAVLAALQDQVASGKHTWDEVVHLKPQWKSVPSGILQDWPDGSPVTIGTLASLMISRSDNTAADALLDIVGRSAVESYAPGNEPLLSTREMFMLKAPRLNSLLERYRAASTVQRRAMLSEIDAQPVGSLTISFDRNALDLEWFFSARDLCGLLDKVGGLDAFAINPGLAQAEDWKSVAYKGGSEPGVLNMSHQLTAFDGTKWCVVVTWNHASADADTLAGVVGPLIQSLR